LFYGEPSAFLKGLLAAIRYRETASAFARVAAAKELLYWGWGRPALPTTTDGRPSEVLQRIERIIVYPDRSSDTTTRSERVEAGNEDGEASQ